MQIDVHSPERRQLARHELRMPLLCFDSNEKIATGDGLELQSRDLSANGISFLSDKLYAIGSTLLVQIFLPGIDSPISAQAVVRSLASFIDADNYKVGLAFTKIGADERLHIQEAVQAMDLHRVLRAVVQHGGSDLHLVVGRPPMIRRDGTLIATKTDPMRRGQVEAMLYPLLTRGQIERFQSEKELDFAFSPSGDLRFRVNLHHQRGIVEAVLRVIPNETKDFAKLGLPVASTQRFCQAESGLFLIAGTTGAGKTTTLAAMVDYINRTRTCVVVTVEDPIEYTHLSLNSLIKQRELGSDTRSYTQALRHVLRQDPDVIVVGEILDADCLNAALRAAETGHLVLSTLHAPSTSQAIDRILNFYPPDNAPAVRQQLSSALNGIMYQSLLPGLHGGRVMATEVLASTPAVRNLIREGRQSQLANMLQTGRALGMHSLEQDVQRLIAAGKVAPPA